MSDDIRSMLASRSRAKVSPRDASLRKTAAPPPIEAVEPVKEEKPVVVPEPEPTPKAELEPETELEPEPQPQPDPTTELQSLQAELDALPEVGKRLAIHLEKGVRNQLVRLCDEQDMTPETYLEAACALIADDEKFQAEVIKEAQNRLQQRKRAGVIRRTMALVQKYSGG